MRIKRFIAPDMRTALRMIRDEQGADAVILSNRAIDGGIEVVAATDYDESLVTQALRAAAPALETVPAAVEAVARSAPAIAVAGNDAFSAVAAPVIATSPPHAAVAASSEVIMAAPTAKAATKPAIAAAPRESLAMRARAVFKIADSPTLAELSAAAAAAAATVTPPAPLAVVSDAATQVTEPEPTRFEAMMAALASRAEPITARAPIAPAVAPTALAAAAAISTPAVTAVAIAAEASTAPVAAAFDATFDADDWASLSADYHVNLRSVAAPVAPIEESIAASIETPITRTAPTLQVVATAAEPDPSILAMREDMASMRQLIERQMEQLTLERLRGSPARAAAYEALLGYGCEDVLAQAIAVKLDPRMEPAEIHPAMFAELARMLTIARTEPLEEGGVIALVGPTGAGKTTTVAKLAARYAARHRARDVALVTTDGERAGAHEQLHAHGRRLGITVCEATGPEGLQNTLAQLTDYPLVLVDTTGYAPRDRALFGQILWLRAARKVRSLLVLPANAHPHDLSEVIRRYRPAAPEGVVLTKLDETGRLGSALSVAVRHGLSLAYTTHGQQVPSDIDTADATRLAQTLEKLRRAADNPLATEDRHAFA